MVSVCNKQISHQLTVLFGLIYKPPHTGIIRGGCLSKSVFYLYKQDFGELC